MQPHWTIYRAMIDCPCKAWQLLQQTQNSLISFEPLIPLSKYDKLALEAFEHKTTAKARKLYDAVETLRQQMQAPAFHKIPHCNVCPFWNSCHQKLKEKDCISLLANMPPLTVSRYHKKGIFTVLQLSHLFKLRRKRNRAQSPTSFLWELKALAVLEKKTYVLKSPEIKTAAVNIYIDFEGLPDENFIYLIGVLINDEYVSFWASNKEEEAIIFFKLKELLDQYPDAAIFHYGSYETKALKKWKYNTGELVNILALFRTHVYPPTYTNGLKDIAGWLGFQWRDPEAGGLKSMEWRQQWQNSVGEQWKTRLLEYNEDDCRALSKVHGWLNKLNADNNVQRDSEMKKHTPYRLQNNDDFSEDFQSINKAAYFDYQQTKIYWRTEKIKPAKKKISFVHAGHGNLNWKPKKVNEIIVHPVSNKCPHCGHTRIYHSEKKRSFIQTDIRFTKTGIRQWVIEYRSGKGKCAACARKHGDSVLKRPRYGDNIFAWSINLYTNYHISFAKISRLLEEQFGIWTNPTYFNDRNYQWWQQFKQGGSAISIQ